MIKLIAAFLMVLDHGNKILMEGTYPFCWFLGRGAYPLFAYVLSCHFARGVTFRPLILRLLFFGFLSAPLVYIAFHHNWYFANILFTFAFSTIAALFFLNSEKRVFHAVCLIALAWTIPTDHIIEYGTAGIFLPVILARIWRGEKEFFAYAFLALILINSSLGYEWIISFLGISATFLIPGFVLLQDWQSFPKDRFINKWFFYIFYPTHLLILLLLEPFLNL